MPTCAASPRIGGVNVTVFCAAKMPRSGTRRAAPQSRFCPHEALVIPDSSLYISCIFLQAI